MTSPELDMLVAIEYTRLAREVAHAHHDLDHVLALTPAVLNNGTSVLLTEECDLVGASFIASAAACNLLLFDSTNGAGQNVMNLGAGANAAAAFSLSPNNVRCRNGLSVTVIGGAVVCVVYARPHRAYREG